MNEWPEARLAATIREYGEERYARRIAREIVRRREDAPIDTTTELVDAIKRAVPTPAQFAGGHPARRTFQAIRIAVNDELGSLERALPAAWELLRPGGRMAVISFHSLEDRLVKRFFAELARGCICPPDLPVCVCGHEPEAELVNRRAVRPSEGEVADNPRAQSGRLRAAMKLDDEDPVPPDLEEEWLVTPPPTTAPARSPARRTTPQAGPRTIAGCPVAPRAATPRGRHDGPRGRRAAAAAAAAVRRARASARVRARSARCTTRSSSTAWCAAGAGSCCSACC